MSRFRSVDDAVMIVCNFSGLRAAALAAAVQTPQIRRQPFEVGDPGLHRCEMGRGSLIRDFSASLRLPAATRLLHSLLPAPAAATAPAPSLDMWRPHGRRVEPKRA